jgi:hypothetical protein
MKAFIFAAALVALAAPAFAEDMAKCTDDNMKMTEMKLMEMKEPAQKDAMMMGIKELDMAKMSMKDSKDQDCMMHLDAAMKATATK